MRSILFVALLAASAAFAAEEKPLPTFGHRTKDSIRITATGHSFDEPGYYHLTTSSLATFLKEKVRLYCNGDFDTVRVLRKQGDSEIHFKHRLGDLRAGKDFVLREGDVVVITCPII